MTDLERGPSSDGKACKSYRRGESICADGFFHKAICSGHAGCVMCGRISEQATPWCMRDELPAHWLNEDGSTRFYPPAVSVPEASS